eukprot:TRINITY_DN29528_c0_g1_i1.p1 TRINITY_DN29528_c0_g1~~TRINITY_DN29528_c0_g1_i1.p1  ORF type:complete len:283 (+),score=66.06 TRINITY_DN29528_c0_g1_i1:88-936(+)
MAAERRVPVHGGALQVSAQWSGGDWGPLRCPLVWGHGLSSSRAREDSEGVWSWEPGCAPVVRYDALGHGVSDSSADPTAYEWPALAGDMRDVAAAAQERVPEGQRGYIAGGSSMGCATAIWAAVQEGTGVRGLLLVLPPTCREARRARSDVLRKAAAKVEQAEGYQAVCMAEPRGQWQPPYVAVKQPMRCDYAGHESAAAALRGAAQSDLPPDEVLRSLTVPALILAWEGDAEHPAETARLLHQLLPHSELHISSGECNEVSQWPALAAAFAARVRSAAPSG